MTDFQGQICREWTFKKSKYQTLFVKARLVQKYYIKVFVYKKAYIRTFHTPFLVWQIQLISIKG